MSTLTALDALYLIREPIESAIASVLTAATGVMCYYEQSCEVKEDPPWIEIELDPGNANNHLHPCPNGRLIRNVFIGTLIIRIRSNHGPSGDTTAEVTERGVLAQAHRNLRAQVLRAMAPGQGLFTTALLPNHQIVSVQPKSQQFGIDVENSMETTEIRFDTMCVIRPGALDAATPLIP